MKREKMIILGKSGSGKDFLLKNIREMGYSTGLKTTTRPKRVNESQNQDYEYITESQFNKEDYIVYQNFKTFPENSPETIREWWYGIKREEFEKAQVFIMTPHELEMIPEGVRKECFVVFLDIDRSIRESRILERGDGNDSLSRRLESDDRDFEKFSDYDLKITDPEFEINLIVDLWD
jgi:guanylate kinase